MKAMIPRYIPKDSTPVTRDGLNAIVYTFTSNKGQPAAVGYRGNSSKHEFYYAFRNEEDRDDHIYKFFESVQQHNERISAAHKTRREFIHGYKVGDILYSSWGYDQTNVEFYEVIATTQKTVTLRELCADYKAEGFMQGRTSPKPHEFYGEPFTRPVHFNGEGEKGVVSYASSKGSYMKRLWEHKGESHFTSSYA